MLLSEADDNDSRPSYKLLFSHPEMVRDLLLEFQSTVDPFMAVRLLTYLGLLYQDLIKQGAFAASGKLVSVKVSPVFFVPVV